MTDDFAKDPLVYSDQVKEKMASDPKLAEAMKDIAACLRQAHQDWQSGKYASFDDAMFAITGERPELITEEELEDELAEAQTK